MFNLIDLGVSCLILFILVALLYALPRSTPNSGSYKFILLMLFGLILVLISEYERIKHFIPIYYALYAFSVCLFVCLPLLTWQGQKKQAGILILDVGRLPRSKNLFWLGIFELVLAGFDTWSVIKKISAGYTLSTLELEHILQVIFLWAIAINLLISGLYRLELRENGICYQFSLLKWAEVKYYNWSHEEPNILTIGFKKPRFFLSRRFLLLRIPFRYRDAIEQILAEHFITRLS